MVGSTENSEAEPGFSHLLQRPEEAEIETRTDLLPHALHYADRKQEHFLCATINGANEILSIRVVSIALIDRSPVQRREVHADALADRASATIVAHPRSGLEPSPIDINLTVQVKAAGTISLLMHGITPSSTGQFGHDQDGFFAGTHPHSRQGFSSSETRLNLRIDRDILGRGWT